MDPVEDMTMKETHHLSYFLQRFPPAKSLTPRVHKSSDEDPVEVGAPAFPINLNQLFHLYHNCASRTMECFKSKTCLNSASDQVSQIFYRRVVTPWLICMD